MTAENKRAAQIAEAKKRLDAEAKRIAKMKEESARPFGCGPAIVDVAPARGAVQRFQPREAVITETGKVRVTRSGFNGHDALRRGDAFDLMMTQSRRRKPDGPALFTAGQVSAGRDYAALYERCAAAGVRCSSIEALGGSGQGSFMDAVIRDSRRLAGLQRAIGTETVLSPRGAQAHSDRGRQVLRAQDIVFSVCVSGRTMRQVLQSYGWSGSTALANKLKAALCDALDRMQGFRD